MGLFRVKDEFSHPTGDGPASPVPGARGDGNPRRKSLMPFGRDAALHDLVLDTDAGGAQETDVACHVLAAQQRRTG